MLEFAPFNEFTAILLTERTERAARQLIRAIGFSAMRQATEQLVSQRLIDDDTAAHIILSLMVDLDLEDDQVQRMKRLGIAVPDELAAPEGHPALEAATEIPNAGDPLPHVWGRDGEGASPPPPDPEPTEDRVCPVCGIPISPAAVGCRAHWRQVKRDQEEA